MFKANPTLRFAAISLIGLACLTGCGSSKDDPFTRASMRSRSDNNDTPPTPPADVSSDATGPTSNGGISTESAVRNVPPVNGATPQAATNGNSLVAGSSPGGGQVAPAVLAIKPIDQRRPVEPFDESARVERTIINLKQIGKAFRKYVDRTGFVPPHIMKTKAGAETLSWRVAILPDLGYQELYDAFDLEQPWDSEVNSKLLDRIPDCFVSPDRFDTSTNYQVFVGENLLFRKLRVDRGSITDGLENTLAIGEVDDRLAVPWTCPRDYEVSWETPTDGLGKLRADGFYAIWASGLPTLIRADVDRIKFLNAMTPDVGDGQLASVIHQPILSIETATTSRQSASPSEVMVPVADLKNDLISHQTEMAATTTAAAAMPVLPRLPRPKEVLVQDSIERVQSLYSNRFKQTRQFSERTAIAAEMLETAILMREDPAGAYAMHEAVISVATAMGDLPLLLKTLDERVQMFEVDAITENGKVLVEFTKANSGPIAAQIDQSAILRRCVPVIFDSIRQDDYDLPNELVRHLLTMDRMAKKRANEIGLSQLRGQLSVAKSYLAQATGAISVLRSDNNDPGANGAVGRYTAFIKGDWTAGLEMLAQGDNDKLAALAKADLNVSSEPQQILAIADAWFELGNATTNKVFRAGCFERAAHWYSLAHTSLPESLSKLHAKTRLSESTAASTGSPLAIVQRIADYVGFELELEIARIKNPAIKTIKTANE